MLRRDVPTRLIRVHSHAAETSCACSKNFWVNSFSQSTFQTRSPPQARTQSSACSRSSFDQSRRLVEVNMCSP